jgi:hypothetical protein
MIVPVRMRHDFIAEMSVSRRFVPSANNAQP